MDTAIHKGKPFWSGVFDVNDGFIREVHPYKRAKAADFHHSYYVSSQSQDAMKQGDAGFFWVDPDGSVNTDWREGSAPKHIVDAIQDQIEPIPHKADGGDVDGITAYHGSPHDFDQFDTSKIGTGEGAQAYGHGLYFAESEPVAIGYRDTLAQQRNPTTSINDLIGQMSKNSPESRTHKNIQWYMKQDPMLSQHADDENIVQQIHTALNGQNEDGTVSESALNAYGKLTDTFGRNAKGHMYHVKINAHPDHFLDWDKPLSEQSEHVRGVLSELSPHLTGDEIHQKMFHQARKELGGKGGAKEYSALVSQKLLNSGIKGIKYLDAGSRNAGKGTHNYVVFYSQDIDLHRRYAQGGFPEAQQDPTSVLHGLPEIEMPDSLQELQDWRGQHKYHPKNGAAYSPDQMLGRGFGPQGVLVHQHRTRTPEYADGGNVEGDVDTSYWGNLWRGLQSIPETAYNYLKNTSYEQMGSDAVDLGKNVYHDITEHPMENLLGALPVVGSGMAAHEAYKLNDRIKQAYASGNHEDAKKLERALALSSLGAIPIFGELSSVGAGAARMAEEAALHGAAETGTRAITNALPKDAYQAAEHMVASKAEQAVDAAKKRMFANVDEEHKSNGGSIKGLNPNKNVVKKIYRGKTPVSPIVEHVLNKFGTLLPVTNQRKVGNR